MALPKLVDFVLDHFSTGPKRDIGKAVAKMTSIPGDWPEVVATEVLNWLPTGSWFDATISPNLREKLGIWDEATFDRVKKVLNTLSQKIIDMSTELDNMDRGDDDIFEERSTLAVAHSSASQEQDKARNATAQSRSKKQQAYAKKSDELKSLQQSYQDKATQFDEESKRASDYEKHKYKNFVENL